MAPPKTMVLSQQQQSNGQQHLDQVGKQGKQRKRKSNNGKQHSQPTEVAKEPKIEIIKEQANNVGSNGSLDNSNNKENIAPIASKVEKQKHIVPNERTTNKNQKQQVPTIVDVPVINKENRTESPKALVSQPDIITAKHRQINNEEADDIDAGIELDGSSNSGSSVKDMNEDQTKSASVSPVMVRGDLVNESCVINQVQPVVEPSSIEQITSALGSTTSSAKKINMTREQLAANQQVIDADEQFLQEKLLNKQKKVSEDGIGQTPSKLVIQQEAKLDIAPLAADVSKIEKPAPSRRKFSSQMSQESQDGLVCKVCEQHVYQMERMLAEKSIYHKRCFRCYQCKIQLRVDNYSSHEGQVYCKAHHRQIFQPKVKLDDNDDVDIVARSTHPDSDYLSQRGRLSELSYSFLQPNLGEIRQRQLIICENEPAELPKDVIRSDTKLDDGIEQLNLNLNNILEKFERGTASNGEESQPSSAGIVIEKPSFSIKQTLLAFESKMADQLNEDTVDQRRADNPERPVVKKLTNLNGFLNQNSTNASATHSKPLAIRRSESLMQRLKKYESRAAGEQIDDDSSDGDENDDNNNHINGDATSNGQPRDKRAHTPRKLTSINLNSLKTQWENGDINKRRVDVDEDEEGETDIINNDTCNGNSSTAEKNEELFRVRQQLARRKSGEACSVKNIYENAIREAQLQQRVHRSDSSDLSALNGLSTSSIQKILLQNKNNVSGSIDSHDNITPTTPTKDHIQLNLHNRANKLKERFEQGLITNSSHDDSDQSDGDEAPALTRLEQLRQEKLEDLSVFTVGEVKAREARNLFQQIDRRISANSVKPSVANSKSLASIGASMRTKLTNQMNAKATPNQSQQQPSEQQPIRLTNNVMKT